MSFKVGNEALKAATRAMKRHPLMRIMKDICDWLDANGIPHARVPLHVVPKIANGQITTPVHLVRAGRPYLDGKGDIAMGSMSVPLRVEPPAVLADWLAGKVPAP